MRGCGGRGGGGVSPRTHAPPPRHTRASAHPSPPRVPHTHLLGRAGLVHSPPPPGEQQGGAAEDAERAVGRAHYARRHARGLGARQPRAAPQCCVSQQEHSPKGQRKGRDLCPGRREPGSGGGSDAAQRACDGRHRHAGRLSALLLRCQARLVAWCHPLGCPLRRTAGWMMCGNASGLQSRALGGTNRACASSARARSDAAERARGLCARALPPPLCARPGLHAQLIRCVTASREGGHRGRDACTPHCCSSCHADLVGVSINPCLRPSNPARSSFFSRCVRVFGGGGGGGRVPRRG